MKDRNELRKAFFETIPQARRQFGNPFFNSIFEFMYEAHLLARPGTKLLNISASKDASESRRELYEGKFFNESELSSVDFWEDHFLKDGQPTSLHTLPYTDNYFDVVVTTKYIMEHVSEPEAVLREIERVLKPGGEAFVVAASVKSLHQPPHDYFRFTEFGLKHLAKKAGFSSWKITPTDGYFFEAASGAHNLANALNTPHVFKWFWNGLHAHVIMPFGFFLHKYDNGRGKRFTTHLLLRAKK